MVMSTVAGGKACRDFLSLSDWSADEIFELLEFAKELKEKQLRCQPHRLLAGKSLAMIFQKPSTRTRVSFEVGMFQLGGQAVYLGPEDIRFGKREPIADTARVLSRYVHLIVARLFGHEELVELAHYATVPVLNGLTDLLHPCQLMADLLTIWEARGHLNDLKVAYIGDGNNMANSWINMAAKFPMTLHLATPETYAPDQEILQSARRRSSSDIRVFREPARAVVDADVIYTDVWVSVGHEAQEKIRRAAFQRYRVTEQIVRLASDDCLIMHGLPARRGDEITAEVIDGPRSVVFDEAENRLHVQKAIMAKLLVP